MQPDLNRMQLIGRLCTDPEFRTTAGEKEMCRFSMVTSETWRDPQGARREKSEIHYVVVFNDFLVGLTRKALRRGSRAMVEGRMERRFFTNDMGITTAVVEVVLGGGRTMILLLDDTDDIERLADIPGRMDNLPVPEAVPW